MKFIEDIHWKHFPDKSAKCLAIFYAPAELALPRLPYYKSTAGLKCGRLLINPGTNNFWQDCLTETQNLIENISSDYEYTIHYGFSMGATGALRFGNTDPKCRSIFAVAPHLVLNREHSRSFELMSEETREWCEKNPEENDVIWRVVKNKNIKQYIYISCFDAQDGIQVRDAQALMESNAKVFFILAEHDPKVIATPDVCVRHFLKYDCEPTVAKRRQASAVVRQASIAAFELMVAVKLNQDVAPIYANLLQTDESPIYLYWMARYLDSKEDFSLAHGWWSRVLMAYKKYDLFEYDVLIGTGNTIIRMGFVEIALGYYREARQLDPSRLLGWFCEANVLKNRRRVVELHNLLSDFYPRFVDDIDATERMRAYSLIQQE